MAAELSEQQVVNHLLFHKALISEQNDGERINEYMRLVKERGDGGHVNIANPFDRAIAIAFELVMDEHLNPWSIDLVQFSSMYLQRLRKDEEIDLVTAGRLILMAWRILRMQSEALRQQAEPPPEPEHDWDAAWDDIPDSGWLVDDADYAYTTNVLDAPQAPIDEKVRRKGDRKVTLYELVEALEEARRDAERREILNEKREAERKARKKQQRVEPGTAAHKEDQEAEIAEVWGRINRFNGHPIPITSLHEPNKDDLMKAFVSVLFLARKSKVRVWQDEFPYGMIWVKNLTLDEAKNGNGNGAGGDGGDDAVVAVEADAAATNGHATGAGNGNGANGSNGAAGANGSHGANGATPTDDPTSDAPEAPAQTPDA